MSGASDAAGDDESEDADRTDGDADGQPQTGSPEDAGADETVTEPAEESTDIAALRREVEEKYDFDDFGPADMIEMSAEEWEVAFDPETWITGEDLLDRVEADLKQRIADREVFARLERHDDRIVAYSDTGYATIYSDGSVEGQGTVLRDVKPTVALCSMESYDVPEDPPDELLPEPQSVPEGTGELGNWMLQAVAGIQVLGGLVLIGGWLLVSLGILPTPGNAPIRSLNVIAMLLAGFIFIGIGLLLFTVVANARLSDKFRAEEYRNRLRAVDLEPGERPDFLPDSDERPSRDITEETRAEQRPDERTDRTDTASDGDQTV